MGGHADAWIQAIAGLLGIVLAWWLAGRGVRGYRQRSQEIENFQDVIDGLHEDITRIRTDRDILYERCRMSEAEREAAYELLRGVNVGVPSQPARIEIPQK